MTSTFAKTLRGSKNPETAKAKKIAWLTHASAIWLENHKLYATCGKYGHQQ